MLPAARGEAVLRLFDVILASLGLVLLGLLLPPVWLANRMWAPGPLFHAQVRVGRWGRPFTMFKLRTMVQDAEPEGPCWADIADPRVTAVGRLLRRCHIDELPNCWNVLRGDMSVVGPRPERPEIRAELVRMFPQYDLRHAVRPGITGYAQIQYRYGGTPDELRVKLERDLHYVCMRSARLYLAIVARTVGVVLRARGQ